MNDDRELPQHPNLERLVLGALLTAGDDQDVPQAILLGTLADTDFTTPNLRVIFATAQAMARDGVPIDPYTIGNLLLKRPDKILPSVVADLTSGLPRILNLPAYIDQLREATRLREIIIAVREIETRAFDRVYSASLVTECVKFAESLSLSARQENDLRTTGELVEAIGGIQQLMSPVKEKTLPWPIAWLNDRTNGLAPGTLSVIAARTSAGKSAFVGQCATHAALRRHRVLLYSLEMPSSDILRRMVGSLGRVNMHRIRSGFAVADERDGAVAALNQLMAVGDYLLFSDRATGTLPGITEALHAQKCRQKAADLLIVDYLQLMTPVGRFDNRVQEVSSLSRGLKLIAKTFGIPVLAVSQLSRESAKQERKPRLDDLRESGTIEQDADNVVFLHPVGDQEAYPSNVQLLLAKQRDGSIGHCDLLFYKQYQRFEEPKPESRVA